MWADPSASVDDPDGPATVHAGTAGDHSLTEGAHSDEYHVVRPLDSAYSEEQLADSQRDVGEIGADPMRYACGYEEQGSACDGSGASALP